MPTWPIPARPRRELATPTPLPSFPSRERPRAAHVDREARLNMRYFPSLPPHPARRIQMSSLPAISNEAGAFAKLQQHFPGLQMPNSSLHSLMKEDWIFPVAYDVHWS